MVDMAAFWMCKLAPTEIAGSDAFDRNELACGEALTHDRASTVARVGRRRRVLQVLVVDDEQETTDGLVTLVRRWGHAVRYAYDGANALKVAAAQHPDVVLLDIEMPLMDGLQVARQLRRDFSRKDCFLIAVTGDAGNQRHRQCSEAGIDLVLVKPANPSVVETILMLECERVNRSRSDKAIGLAMKFSSRLATASGRQL
jgi:CheY-like chemotaxis protein